jgi:hypothetical protein
MSDELMSKVNSLWAFAEGLPENKTALRDEVEAAIRDLRTDNDALRAERDRLAAGHHFHCDRVCSDCPGGPDLTEKVARLEEALRAYEWWAVDPTSRKLPPNIGNALSQDTPSNGGTEK